MASGRRIVELAASPPENAAWRLFLHTPFNGRKKRRLLDLCSNRPVFGRLSEARRAIEHALLKDMTRKERRKGFQLRWEVPSMPRGNKWAVHWHWGSLHEWGSIQGRLAAERQPQTATGARALSTTGQDVIRAAFGKFEVDMDNPNHDIMGNRHARLPKSSDKEAAETILEQMGGRKFLTMIGGDDRILYGREPEGPYLLVKFKARAKRGIGMVRVTLGLKYDKYRMELYDKKGNRKLTTNGFPLYADDLADWFEEYTGLAARL